MSVLERRLQVLVDQHRYALLEDEARRSGRSVGAIVRSAIDRHFEVDALLQRRRDAAGRLLADTPDDGPGEEWSAAKAALAADLDRALR